MRAHQAFSDGSGSRVRRNVDLRNAGAAAWATGTGSATSLVPGSPELAAFEAAIANDSNVTQDRYGHGTHVASIAAGSAKSYGSTTPDTTGIAPGASVYDVKVLDDAGAGTLSDALQGIQWVIYHAQRIQHQRSQRQPGGQLAETWLTDPLVRRRAQRHGRRDHGRRRRRQLRQERARPGGYGTISSPASIRRSSPSARSTSRARCARSDDSVNLFSSRGPTRGSSSMVDGVLRSTTCSSPTWSHPATSSSPRRRRAR
jgi:hypothetical protein